MSSAAVVIGALRVNEVISQGFVKSSGTFKSKTVQINFAEKKCHTFFWQKMAVVLLLIRLKMMCHINLLY